MKTFFPFLFLLLLFACQDEDPKTPVGPPAPIPFYCNVDIYLDIEDAEGRNLVTMFSDSLDREYVRAEGYTTTSSKLLKTPRGARPTSICNTF